MLATFLDRLRQTVTRRPRAVVLVAAVTVAIAAGLGMGIELRTSTRELAPAVDATQARWDALRADFHDPDPLILVVEGGTVAERRRLVDAVVRDAAALDEVAAVHARVDLEWMADRVLWLLPADELETAVEQLEEILGSDPVVAVAGFDDLNRRLAARLETALAEGASSRPAAADAAGRLQRLMAAQARFLREPEAMLAALPASIAAAAGRAGAGLDDAGYLRTSGDALLLFVTRASDDPARAAEVEFVRLIRELVSAASRDSASVRIGFTGPPAMTTDEMTAIRDDSRRTSAIAMVGVAVLASLAFRRRRYAVAGMITLAVGVIWSLGAVRLELGYLNMITTSLIPILVGIGIDYAVHPLSQFEVERRAGLQPREAVAAAFRRTSTAVTVSAVTTAGAFLCFLWMDFRGFAELGLVAGVGVLLCLLASLVVLPALLVWWPPPSDAGRAAPAIDRVWGPRQAAALCSRPRLVLGAALLLSLVAALFARDVELRTGLVDLLPLRSESLRYLELINEDPNFSAYVNLTTADSVDELAAQAARAAAEPSVLRFESLRRLVPDDAAASARAIARAQALLDRVQVRERTFDPAALHDSLVRLEEVLAESADAAFVGGQGAAAGALEAARADAAAAIETLASAPTPLRASWPEAEVVLRTRLAEWLQQLRRSAATAAPTPQNLPGQLRERLITRSGRLIGYLYPRGDIFDPHHQQEFNLATARVDADAVGFPMLFQRMSSRITTGFGDALALASILVIVVLLLDLRRPSTVAMALLPVLLGTLWLLGLMGAIGLRFNLANLIALPLVIGVGIDNGVHLMHRHRLEAHEPIATVLAQTGRAILIASLTTMIGFGSLALATHRGMASLGVLLFLGVGACMVASLVVLPNLLALLATTPPERRGG